MPHTAYPYLYLNHDNYVYIPESSSFHVTYELGDVVSLVVAMQKNAGLLSVTMLTIPLTSRRKVVTYYAHLLFKYSQLSLIDNNVGTISGSIPNISPPPVVPIGKQRHKRSR